MDDISIPFWGDLLALILFIYNVIYGINARRSKKVKEKERKILERWHIESTAYHEAGHAVYHTTFNSPIDRVVIEPSEPSNGYCRYKDYEIEKTNIHFFIDTKLAGPLAEYKYLEKFKNNVDEETRGKIEEYLKGEIGSKKDFYDSEENAVQQSSINGNT